MGKEWVSTLDALSMGSHAKNMKRGHLVNNMFFVNFD